MKKEVAKKQDKSVPIIRPVTDILEREDGFHIYMDVPGVKKEDLVLDMQKNQIVVTGVSAVEYAKDEKFMEVQFGNAEYRRTVQISDMVDREKIKAKLNNGTLELYLPRAEETKPRRIEITSE